MAIYKELSAENISTSKSSLTQLVDILGSDVSESSSRKKYQLWTSSSVGSVTSSLFQTVFDQDFTLQTANAIFDITFGLHSGSEVVTEINPTIDSNGKYLFPATSLMMREKMDIYRLFAQNLLGSETEMFQAVSGSLTTQIKEALFISFKRLFARDQIKRETFALRLASTAALNQGPTPDQNITRHGSGSLILTDINSSNNKAYSFGGQVSTIVNSANTAQPLGLLFLDKGVLVLNISGCFDQARQISGSIKSVQQADGEIALSASLRQMMSSASIDDFLDHVCSTRITSSDETACTFQNLTNINSTLYFCNLAADEFNYSSNPTYTDANSRIVVIDEGQEENQTSFVFLTSCGLYDANNNLLAIGKFSRPVYKDASRSLTFRLRLDWLRKPNKINNLHKYRPLFSR